MTTKELPLPFDDKPTVAPVKQAEPVKKVTTAVPLKQAIAPVKQKVVIVQPTVRDLIEGESFKSQIAKTLPKHLTPDRFIRIAITAIQKTPALAQCNQASLFGALLNLSQLGLEPDGRNAHLLPYENRRLGITECQLIIDYKGLVGSVSNIHADIICNEDEFEYDKGEIKKHKINFKKPRGKMYAVYAIVRFKDGSEKAEVMTEDEVVKVRARSKAAGSSYSPWNTDFNEMAKKTVFRRLSKWLSISSEYRDALTLDDDRFEDIEKPEVKEVPTKDFADLAVDPNF